MTLRQSELPRCTAPVHGAVSTRMCAYRGRQYPLLKISIFFYLTAQIRGYSLKNVLSCKHIYLYYRICRHYRFCSVPAVLCHVVWLCLYVCVWTMCVICAKLCGEKKKGLTFTYP